MTLKDETKYKPRAEARAWLERGLVHIESVSYEVTLRWVFYRLWDEGLFPLEVLPGTNGNARKAKQVGYDRFKEAARRARHANFGGWTPDTIVDDTRKYEVKGYGYHDMALARSNYLSDTIKEYPCIINHYPGQEYYTLIGFEARAMAAQFREYTHGIDLVPMGGDPSIPLKWDVAKLIEHRARADVYGLPVVFLFFGDSDEKGGQIFETTMRHITRWCKVPFEYKWCGLTSEQVDRYQLDEAIDKAGYQWESLDDPQAREIIESSISPYFDIDIYNRAKAESEVLQAEFEDEISDL